MALEMFLDSAKISPKSQAWLQGRVVRWVVWAACLPYQSDTRWMLVTPIAKSCSNSVSPSYVGLRLESCLRVHQSFKIDKHQKIYSQRINTINYAAVSHNDYRVFAFISCDTSPHPNAIARPFIISSVIHQVLKQGMHIEWMFPSSQYLCPDQFDSLR